MTTSDDPELMAELSAEADALSSVPSDQNLSRARAKAQEQYDLEMRVDELERALKEANIRLWDVSTKELPDLLKEIGIDSIGLPEAGVDLKMVPYYKANISAEWPSEQREAGFAYLESIGGGDLIKNTVTVVFPRGHFDELLEWVEKVRGLNLDFDPPAMEIGKAVPWNTLTAFLREQTEKGKILDLEKIGGTVATITKIKERK